MKSTIVSGFFAALALSLIHISFLGQAPAQCIHWMHRRRGWISGPFSPGINTPMGHRRIQVPQPTQRFLSMYTIGCFLIS